MHTGKNPQSSQARKSIGATILLLQLFLGSAHAQDREKIRVALSTVSFTFLVNLIAKDAGIFRKHGLDVESILVSGPAQVAALAAGEIDYNSSFIPGLLLAAKGLPATIVMATTKSPLFLYSFTARHYQNRCPDRQKGGRFKDWQPKPQPHPIDVKARWSQS